jgi:hypothetical protein
MTLQWFSGQQENNCFLELKIGGTLVKRRNKPVTTVSIILLPEENSFHVYFDYDINIVKLMHFCKGHYRSRPMKHWKFPMDRKEMVIEELNKKKLYVRIFKKRQEFPQDQDTTSMLTHCKDCGKMAFCGKDGLCTKCM